MGKVAKTIGTIAAVAVVGFATGGLGFIAGAPGLTAAYASASAAAFGVATTAAIRATVAAGLGLAAQAFAKKPSMDFSDAMGRLNLSVNPNAPGKWIFGETACATDVVYAEQLGSKDDYIAQIVAAAAHRVESFGDLYVNDELITFSSGAATGDWSGALWRATRSGLDGGTAITSIGGQSLAFPSTAKGRGHAHFGLLWRLGQDKTQQGLPNRITQVIKGAPVYDPRLDSTRGGSGSHRADDQSTWEYTNAGTDIGANWALIVAFYLLGWHTEDGNNNLIFGVGADPDDVDWDSVITAANICEETVDSKPRFRVGGVFPTSQQHESIIKQLEASIGGKVSRVGGKYYIWAPNDDLTTFGSITENDLVRDAGVEFTPSGPIENLYNIARGRYVEPDELYQPKPYPEVRESTAVTEDGRERVMEHDFSIVQDVEIAQRVARYLVRRSRFTGTWRFAMGPKGLTFRPFSVTTLNCQETNNTDVTVRVIEMQFSPSGAVVMEVIEEDSSIYDTSAALGTPVTLQDPGSFDPSASVAVSNLAAGDTTIIGSDGTVSVAFEVTWDDPGALVDWTQVIYRVTGTTKWQELARRRVDFTDALIGPVEPLTDYDIWVRHITRFGAVGAWSTISAATAGDGQVTQGIVNQSLLATKGSRNGNNLALNPGAEDNAFAPHATLANGGTWSIDSTNPRSGDYCFKYDSTGQTGVAVLYVNGSSAAVEDNQHCRQGDQIIAEAWFRRLSGTIASTAALIIYFYDSSGTQISAHSTGQTTATTTYQQLLKIKSAPAGASSFQVQLQIANNSGDTVTLIDDLSIALLVRSAGASPLMSGGLISSFNPKPITGWTDTGSAARINIQASTMTLGGRTISYPSGSVSGLAYSTTYYVYMDDPDYNAGGSYAATTSLATATANDYRIFIGAFTTGTSGGGGGTAPPGYECVACDMHLSSLLRAGEAVAGDPVYVLGCDGYMSHGIESVEHSEQPCVELLTETGARLVCSTSTPLTLRDGRVINVLAGAGEQVAVLHGETLQWETLESVTPVAPRRVAHIHVGGRTYAAGADPKKLIFTHNPAKR